MKYRRAAAIDKNQPEIVRLLRMLPGVTVQPGHDDILVGYRRNTYWFEIKDPDKALSKKTGKFLEGAITPAQKILLETWTGHYAVASSIDGILWSIGYKNKGEIA